MVRRPILAVAPPGDHLPRRSGAQRRLEIDVARLPGKGTSTDAALVQRRDRIALQIASRAVGLYDHLGVGRIERFSPPAVLKIDLPIGRAARRLVAVGVPGERPKVAFGSSLSTAPLVSMA